MLQTTPSRHHDQNCCSTVRPSFGGCFSLCSPTFRSATTNQVGTRHHAYIHLPVDSVDCGAVVMAIVFHELMVPGLDWDRSNRNCCSYSRVECLCLTVREDPTHPLFIATYSTVCFAKHVKDKAAKWAKAKRPKKHRLSDINRTPIIYELHSLTKPSEYDISEAPAAPVAKPAQTE